MASLPTTVSRIYLAVALLSVLLALWYKPSKEKERRRTLETSSTVGTPPKTEQSKTTNDWIIYAIGDLHGDVECAKQWVNRAGVISKEGEWINEKTRLVFLGDYVDKGPTSKQTVQYVKSLTEEYPSYVTAIIGNHELELLRDRTETMWADGNAGYYQLVYGAVHPAEYLNYVETIDEEVDQLVVDALYNASLQVYGNGLYRSVYFVPDTNFAGSILHHVPKDIQDLVRDRLTMYQKSYLDTFRSGTELGSWLEQREIAAVVGDTLFVHGGLPGQFVDRFLPTKEEVYQLNRLFQENSKETSLGKFLKNSTPGQIIYNLVVYRGNHKAGCEELKLPEGISRLAVGHTPGKMVREHCDGSFLALDSSLSRWFRNSGNQYCKGDVQVSSGQYQCKRKSDECQGQIVRIQGGKVDLLDM